MLARVSSTFTFALLALGAVSTVLAGGSPPPSTGNECNVGGVQCCQDVQSAGSPYAQSLLGLLGIIVGDLTVPVGITCSPLGLANSQSCTAQPVCCTDNSFNGVVAIGCTPINLNL